MSINLEKPLNDENLPLITLHHLPCKIESNEAANITSYFLPKYEDKDGKTRMNATFRGRPLDGKVIEFSNDYTGYLIAEKQKPFSEEESRQMNVIGKFNGFTQWYLDSQFSSGNSIETACKIWPNTISKAIHDPIPVPESE